MIVGYLVIPREVAEPPIGEIAWGGPKVRLRNRWYLLEVLVRTIQCMSP